MLYNAACPQELVFPIQSLIVHRASGVSTPTVTTGKLIPCTFAVNSIIVAQ